MYERSLNILGTFLKKKKEKKRVRKNDLASDGFKLATALLRTLRVPSRVRGVEYISLTRSCRSKHGTKSISFVTGDRQQLCVLP